MNQLTQVVRTRQCNKQGVFSRVEANPRTPQPRKAYAPIVKGNNLVGSGWIELDAQSESNTFTVGVKHPPAQGSPNPDLHPGLHGTD